MVISDIYGIKVKIPMYMETVKVIWLWWNLDLRHQCMNQCCDEYGGGGVIVLYKWSLHKEQSISGDMAESGEDICGKYGGSNISR